MLEENNDQVFRTRHSLAHILAMAVKKLYPKSINTIGPVVDNGFYYDFDFPEPISENNLKEIEREMKKIIKKNILFQKKNIDIKTAQELFKNNPYKLELIKELDQNKKPIRVYISDDFIDLCEGPHLISTTEINSEAWQLERIAGAYWRGDEKNKMLTRIYGIAFAKKEELIKFLEFKKEAQERDHRKLGKELDLFCFSPLVGAGLPLLTPKGTIIKDELQKYIEKICRQFGFEKVSTPHLAKIDLYELSGHADKFSDELFKVSSRAGHNFVMKPVQCPHQTQIYASKPRSYRDLPIRYMESEKQYRAEKTGEIGGLTRVYAITVEDGHTFCRPDQIKIEIINIINIIKNFYESLGLWDHHWVSLSVRDKKYPEKYIGSEEDWNQSEKILTEIATEMKLDAKYCEGEAALYGPKLDFMFTNTLGKEIQIPTVQLDFATPKKFNLTYTDIDGQEKNPIMIHRAILGSYERFMALLIEHFIGAFPFWLAPIQIKILSINDKNNDYLEEISSEFKKYDFRIEIDKSNESLGKKIRKAESQKIPYLIIIGNQEAENKTINIRKRNSSENEERILTDFINELLLEKEP